MTILFGKHTGKRIDELESSYLLWLIEFCESADWTLITACKSELSSRLELDWSPPPDELKVMQASLDTARARIITLEKIIALHRHAAISAEKYIRNPALIEHDLAFIREC